MSANYYKDCTVHIRTKRLRDHLPSQQHLRSFLRDFGKILGFYEWFIGDKYDANDQPNNALVLLESPGVVQQILKDSSRESSRSFWTTQSLVAYPLRPSYAHIFHEKLSPLDTERTTAAEYSSRSSHQPRTQQQNHDSGSSRPRSDPTADEPPSKRARIEHSNSTVPSASGPRHTVNGNSNGTSLQPGPSKSFALHPSRTPSTTPESPEWLRSRVSQLESELEATKAARDMAISEQNIALAAHEAEKKARREALTQKSAAEAAQSRAEAERARLILEVENTKQSKDSDNLQSRLAEIEERLKKAQVELSESANQSERIKMLERELEEALDRGHKLLIQKTELEDKLEQAKSSATQPDKSTEEVKRLQAALGSAHEQLGCTQKSLESMQRKYSAKQRKYEATKEKLGTYKERLQNETAIIKSLQDTLTPAAYNSLGATHQTLGAFLSAIGLPPVENQGVEPKEESE